MKKLQRGDEFAGARVMGEIPMDRNGKVQATIVIGPEGTFLVPARGKPKTFCVRFTADEKEMLRWASQFNGVSLNRVIRALVTEYVLSHRTSGDDNYPHPAADRVELLKLARMDSSTLIPAGK